MYYPDYNPAIHDIFLYGPGNTGYPIGINPNSLIAGASADFSGVQPRYRRFNIEILSPPIGATVGVYPNYYNANIPICTVISNKIVGLNSHYTANKPSDSGPYGLIGNPGYYAKYTGTTTAYPINSVILWNSTLSGFCTYGPISGFYNYLPTSKLPAGYSFYYPFYFTGSPEIPGFVTGATFYQILNPDNSFAEFLNSSDSINVEPIKIISPYDVLTEEQKTNLDSYLISYYTPSQTSMFYYVPVEDVYIWDGNDKIIPADKLSFGFVFQKSQPTNPEYVAYSNPYIDVLFTNPNIKIAVGDSSSQLIYFKNNKLYFIGSALAAGATRVYTQSKWIEQNVTYPTMTFSVYCGVIFPNLQGLQTLPLDRNHYSTSLNSGVTLATKIDIDRINNKMTQIITGLSNLLNNITS